MSMYRSVLKITGICLLLLTLLSVAAISYGDIRISRPVDGSTVRETVAITVPSSSVPENGFVVYSVDGQFRAAQSSMTSDGSRYVYYWDTQAMNPNQDIPLAERRPRDGRHTISVQACDASGAKVGSVRQVTVYVKNHLSASDIPSRGIKLRYSQRPGSANNYRFDCRVDITSAQGIDPNLLAIVGEGAEGEAGIIKKTYEYSLDRSSAFVSQQLVGGIKRYSAGRLSLDQSFSAKRGYQTEDNLGRANRVDTPAPGQIVALQLPILPAHAVRIGDVWKQPTRVLWDPTSGQTVTLAATSTFDGLEWRMGHPCAKITTVFSGSTRVPFSNIITNPVSMTGQTVTYFAYRAGKAVMSTTTAKGKASVASSVVVSALQSGLPAGSSLFAGQQRQAQQVGMPGQGMGMMGGTMAGRQGMRNRPMGGAPGAMGMGAGRLQGPGAAGMGAGPMGMQPAIGARGLGSAGGVMPGNVGGPAGMEGPMAMGARRGVPGAMGGATGAIAQEIDVDFVVTESVELVR